LSALAGWIAEARNTGTRPNKNVTPRGNRQAESKHPPVRRQNQARWIIRRIDPVDGECRQTTSHNLLTLECDVQFCPQNL
jgi:hypothetical protein